MKGPDGQACDGKFNRTCLGINVLHDRGTSMPSRPVWRKFAVAPILLLVAFGLLGETNADADCDYYASPNGTGNGLTQSTPFMIQNFFVLAAPGRTLCLREGIYRGSSAMIDPPLGLNGSTAGADIKNGICPNCITVRALNDGQVLIDGQFVRNPVALQDRTGWIVEGINAKNAAMNVFHLDRASNIILRRVIGWDASLDTSCNTIYSAHSTRGPILIEDSAGFGTAAFQIETSQEGNNLTVRRFWGRFEGTRNVTNPHAILRVHYRNTRNTYENVIGEWWGKSFPSVYRELGPPCKKGAHALYDMISDGGPPISPATNTVFIINMHDDTTQDANTRVLGSLAYVRSGASTIRFNRLVSAANHWPSVGFHRMELRHVFAFVDPSLPDFRKITGFALGSIGYKDNLARNLSSVRGSADNIHGDWNTTANSFGTSRSLVTNPWTTTGNGANLCKRYKNRTLTNVPLWPWPMNARIKAVTAQPAYAGPCGLAAPGDTCVLSHNARPQVDVTQVVQSMLGTIPSQCKQ